MFHDSKSFALCALLIGMTVGIHAQQVGNTVRVALPGEGAVAPPYGMPITLAQAERAIAAARTEAARLKSGDIAIAVADTHGELVAFVRMDNTAIHSILYAQLKARAAARVRRFTATPPPDIAAAVSTTPDFVGTPGGVPIVVNGKTIGAVGVSGAEEADLAIAEAAAKSLAASG
jgi:glc operon protein GlcG